MIDRECALCGAPYQDDRSVLCPKCRDAEQARVRRMGRFIEVYTAMRQAIQAIDRLQGEYPEAAVLVAQARSALYATYPGIEKVTHQLKAADLEATRKMYEAHGRV